MKESQNSVRVIGIASALLALLIFGLRYGYFFGQGDQDEFVPYLLSLLDSSRYSVDWFVSQQVEHFNVRTYFTWLMYPFAKLFSVPVAFFAAYLVSFFAIAYAVFLFARQLIGSSFLAFFAPIIILSITHKWTLGSNDLVYSMLVPEMFSWPLAIWAFQKIIQRSYVQAGILLGMACWFQVLVGIQSALLHGIVLSVFFIRKDVSLKGLISFSASFLLSSLPSTVPIVLSLFESMGADKNDLFYILANFRNPFHHLFFSFSIGSVVKFSTLLLAGLLPCLAFRQQLFGVQRGPESNEESDFGIKVVLWFVVCCGLVLVVNLLLTEFFPVLFVAKLQLFKLTVLVKVLSIVLLLVVLERLLDRKLAFVDSLSSLSSRSARVGFMGVAVVSFVGWVGLASNRENYSPAKEELSSWVKTHSSSDALFLVNPSNSWFRTLAERSIYINYASFPYRDPDMLTWFERIQKVAPIGRPDRGLGIKPIMDDSYIDVIPQLIDTIPELDYALVPNSGEDPLPNSNLVFRNSDWVLYQLSN